MYAGGPLLAEATAQDLVVTNTARYFWISWSNPIRFGTGSVVGENIIMEYTDANPLPISWISLAGWDVPGNVLFEQGKSTSFLVCLQVPLNKT